MRTCAWQRTLVLPDLAPITFAPRNLVLLRCFSELRRSWRASQVSISLLFVARFHWHQSSWTERTLLFFAVEKDQLTVIAVTLRLCAILVSDDVRYTCASSPVVPSYGNRCTLCRLGNRGMLGDRVYYSSARCSLALPFLASALFELTTRGSWCIFAESTLPSCSDSTTRCGGCR